MSNSITEIMEIKPFTIEYIEDVAEIHIQCHDGWSVKGIISDIANTATKDYVAVCAGRAVGFCSYLVTDDAELEFICVHPSFRKQGIATKLLNDTLGLLSEDINKVVLEVRESNEDAISIYRKFGFQNIGTRHDFYTTPNEDAVVMELNIKGAKDLD